MKLALAVVVAIAIAACTRVVVLTPSPDAVNFTPDATTDSHAPFPDAGNDGNDGGPLPDALGLD